MRHDDYGTADYAADMNVYCAFEPDPSYDEPGRRSLVIIFVWVCPFFCQSVCLLTEMKISSKSCNCLMKLKVSRK